MPRRAVARFALFVLVLLLALAALRWTPLSRYASQENLAAVFTGLRQAWWSPLALVGLFAVVSPLGLPISPLIFAGGAVFGTAQGALLNTAGSLLGAALSYLLAKFLGQEFVSHIFGPRLEQVEHLLEKHGFWTLVRIRFLPIPFPLVNFGAALAGIRPATFFLTSLLGLAPSILIYTYFADVLFHAPPEARLAVVLKLVAALAAVLALSLLPPRIAAWRRRYQERLARFRRETRGEP